MQTNRFFDARTQIIAPQVVEALNRRQFEAYYCETAVQAREKALCLIPPASTVSWGGSESVEEIGLLEAVKKGPYTVLDRDATETQQQRLDVMRRAFQCDYFLMGSNALSADGQLVNIDGGGNRVASLTFGPAHVIVIVGVNKICDNLDEAILRARHTAAPLNAQRVLTLAGKGTPTPCTVTGICADCNSPECICNTIVITRRSGVPGRIKVLLVGEQLGL